MLNHNPMFPPEFPMPEHPGTTPQKVTLPPTPIIFEREGSEEIPLRAYAAILLRVPESGIDWLDKMIVRSRELDRARPRAVASKKKK
jgi:hypothetical protein